MVCDARARILSDTDPRVNGQVKVRIVAEVPHHRRVHGLYLSRVSQITVVCAYRNHYLATISPIDLLHEEKDFALPKIH